MARSADFTGAMIFLGCVGVLIAMSGSTLSILRHMMQEHLELTGTFSGPDIGLAKKLVSKGMLTTLSLLAPLLGVAFALALATNYFQVGSIFTFEPLSPKLSNLNPIQGIKNKMFSSRAWIELGKSMLKASVVALICHRVIKADMDQLSLMVQRPVQESWRVTTQLLGSLCIRVGIVLLFFAALDVFLQRWLHMKQMRMSKEEVKREYKESEGDPYVKGRRKQIHEEILSHGVREGVRKATVVVVNPTHIAVALHYERGSEYAPQVTAKGEDRMAQQIRNLAREYGVPTTRNVPLARALNELEVGTEIPEELYNVVAEILNWVWTQTRA